MTELCDIALVGGRLIDPASGTDGVRHIGIVGDRIAVVDAHRIPDSDRLIDIEGLVVSPGFIDLHSHAQTRAGARLQALDGVTTALELEAGAIPVDRAYDTVSRQLRPIHYGFSASWALARFAAVAGLEWSWEAAEGGMTTCEFFEHHQDHPRWDTPASDEELARIVRRVERGLDEGALGIGVLLGYAPSTEAREFRSVAELAARRGVPVFVHSRHMSIAPPGTSEDGIRELIEVAEETGAQVHICHINSTSLTQIPSVAHAIVDAQERGVRLTTEFYPYGAASTGIGAAFFAPDRLHRLGVGTEALRYLPTGERVASAGRLANLRRDDPGGLSTVDLIDTATPAGVRQFLQSALIPGAAVASDAMPLTSNGGPFDPDAWPLSPGVRVHPRSAGTFARTLAWLVRDLGVFTLDAAIARMSTIPARILAEFVPAFRSKGSVARGMDADLVVFDPATVHDQATFDEVRPSTGFRYVLVAGAIVVADGELDPRLAAGRPQRRADE